MSTGIKAATAIVAVLLLTALTAWVYDAGRTKERALWQAQEAQRAKDFSKQLQAEFDRGQAASADLQKELQALQVSYDTLEGQYRDLRRRVPLVLPVHIPAVAARGRAEPEPDGQQPALPGDASAGTSQPPGVGDLHLSRAAVWMWNSSLAGTDMPTDTCGSADTSDEACAPDAGVTLDDAWDNHKLNAQNCAADRIRHAALIKFLTERPAR